MAKLYRDVGKDTRFLTPLFDRWQNVRVKDITAGAIQDAARPLSARTAGNVEPPGRDTRASRHQLRGGASLVPSPQGGTL